MQDVKKKNSCFVGVFTDAVVDALETEIGRLQSFYQRHESLYSQVKQWEQLLEEFTVLEVSCHLTRV